MPVLYRIADWPRKKARPSRGRFYEFAARRLLEKFPLNTPIPVLQIRAEDSGLYTFDHFLSELPSDDRAFLKLPYAMEKSDNDWQAHGKLRILKKNGINKAATNLERMQETGHECYRLNVLEPGKSLIIIRPQDAIAESKLGEKIQNAFNAQMTQVEHMYQGIDQAQIPKNQRRAINLMLKEMAVVYNETTEKFLALDLRVREISGNFYRKPKTET